MLNIYLNSKINLKIGVKFNFSQRPPNIVMRKFGVACANYTLKDQPDLLNAVCHGFRRST